MQKKPLPVGIDDFEKLIRNNYYYVDKTLFIKELLVYPAEKVWQDLKSKHDPLLF